ncbi:hypothetical protein [Micromonospora alfalfae]|uniref:hypothetical protein n=1 Tax=Micromonospora alfalfae TaxID=2911212 RepID=UPI001EE8BDA1|nr:hypothetical protein [Micromonospora alfalfae]
MEADLGRMRQQRDDYAAELARITGTGARERLARHLFLDRARGNEICDQCDEELGYCTCECDNIHECACGEQGD